MDFDVPEVVQKRPFYFCAVLSKAFLITSQEDRAIFQRQFLTNVLKGCRQLLVLDDSWTQVGILTGKLASTSDFNWSQKHISVSVSVTILFSDMELACCLLYCEHWRSWSDVKYSPLLDVLVLLLFVIGNSTSLLCAADGTLERCVESVEIFVSEIWCDCRMLRNECTIMGGRMIDGS